MNFNNYILAFVIIINLNLVFGQSLICRYNFERVYYTCELELINPNGLNNISNIDGIHNATKIDSDVKGISQKAGSNSINIPSIICEKFKYLQDFDIQSGKIRSIDDYSLRSCKDITNANFYKNAISYIHENAFIENTKLQTLLLYNNQLTTLPENVFGNLQNLQILWLDSNFLSDLPLNIFKSTINLIQLDLRSNLLSNLKTEWFQSLKNLKYLYLGANNIEVLPENIFGSLEKLTLLYLNNNKLKIINSNSFGVVQKLDNILLDNNQISAIDEKFVENGFAAMVTYISMKNNLCSNYSAYNVNKTIIKSNLNICFENFETSIGTTTISPSYCNIVDPAAELCDIKNKIGLFQGNLTNIVQSAFDLINYQRDRITKNENDIKDLKSIINQQQISLEEKDASIAEIREKLIQIQSTSDSNAINAEIQNIQANINFLLTRPCKCD